LINDIFRHSWAALALFIALPCCAPALILDQPGHYTLGEDIIFSPGVADSIISIQANDVTLDLGGWSVIQGNATANVDGITIAPGLQRVTVTNGRIRNITGRGIFVNTSTQPDLLEFSHLEFENCQTQGISFEGTSSASRCTISDCNFTNCLLPAGGSTILRLVCVSSVIRNITVNTKPGGGLASGIRNLITIVALVNCIIENIHFSSFSSTDALRIFSVTGLIIEANIFRNISCNGCVSIGSTFTFFDQPSGTGLTGCLFSNITLTNFILNSNTVTFFNINGATSENLFIGCAVEQAIASTGQAFGFRFTSCTNQILIDCIASGIRASAGNCTPFSLTSCTNCDLIRCYSLNNTTNGGGSSIAGFLIDTSIGCLLRDCIASTNTASAGLCRGFFFVGGSDHLVDNNAAYRNTGSTVAVGFTQGSATNAFLRNVAIRNGTTLANQFAAFAVKQNNVQNINSTNSLTQAWTNVGLI
jgi:hypothetical protein